MVVMTGHRGQTHNSRHRLSQLFAYIHEAGKGMYIGGDDFPPHHHHHHSSLSTTTTLTPASTTSGLTRGTSGPEVKYSNSSSHDALRGRGRDAKGSLSPQRNPFTNPSSLSSSQATHHLAPPYIKPPFSNTGFSHTAKNGPSLNSGPSPSFHHDKPDLSILPFSTTSNHPNIEHLPTLSPLNLHRHAPNHAPPIAWDIQWNHTDNLCANRSAGNYDCWDLFNPDDNTTTAAASLLDEEYRMWTLLLIVIPLLTVFGNILVVLSVVKERSLKTVTNYFICSLAVADIMVAVVVMPFAVYMEVTMYRWTLHDGLCDAWVASDVLGCTASILNLTAICVDRFIAVTQPIKYAKHKNSKRVFVMLAVTWVISVAIAAPIALGVNYSDARKFGDCQFFNSDFIIYSSMGSFYIPSVIMCCLYWKIYRVIRLRALKTKMAKRLREVDKRTLQGVIENPAAAAALNPNDAGGVEATLTTGLAKIDNGRVTTYNTTSATTTRLLGVGRDRDNFGTNPNSNSDDNSDDDDDDDDDSGSGSANNNSKAKSHKKLGVASVVMQISPRFLMSVDDAELISNPAAPEAERLENNKPEAGAQYPNNGGCIGAQEPSASTSGGTGQTCANEVETPFTSVKFKGDGTSGNTGLGKKGSFAKHGQEKRLTKFNFNMRVSRKRKEKSSSRREKKATKTLAIVLGVFLACWVPFFTLNIIKAICIRYDLMDNPACQVDPIFFSLFQWLGYINSFLNPVIYTIFNQEFRKAFRKLLTEPCR